MPGSVAIPIVVLLAGALALLLLNRAAGPRNRSPLTLVIVGMAFLALLTLARDLSANTTISRWRPFLGSELAYHVDGLAFLFATLMALVGLATITPGLGCSEYSEGSSHATLLALLAAGFSFVFSANLITLCTSWVIFDLAFLWALAASDRGESGTTSPPGLGGTEGGHEGELKPLGQEYVEMVQDGVVAAQYIRSWQLQPEDAVLLAPAYTFLMSNRPVDYQFWLNAGGRGWWERLYQPLTHPYVLSRHWPSNEVWSDADEFETRQEALYRLTLGLIRRCRRKIYLGLSELGEQGYEQQGPLLQAIQRVLRRLPTESEAADV